MGTLNFLVGLSRERYHAGRNFVNQPQHVVGLDRIEQTMLKCPPTQLLAPAECRPPHRVTHPEKRDDLVISFLEFGWDLSHPDLVGYQEDGYVQLLSGSHRFDAARIADINLPVRVYRRAEIEEIWGNLDEWRRMIDPK